MLDAEQRERYLRHILLKEVGAQGQQKLLAARVLIVGAGGLGAPVLQYLAAAGVGTIGLADDDAVALSNLQRQIVYASEDVGEDKVARALAFVRRLNPGLQYRAHKERVRSANAAALFAGYDLVIEGVDNFQTRLALNEAAIATKTPLLSAAIGRFEGQVTLIAPWKGENLPCYRCLVPEAPPADAVVNCAEEGVLGPLAGVVGSLAALETIKVLLGIGAPLAGRLLIFDGLGGEMRSLAFPRDPECASCGKLSRRD